MRAMMFLQEYHVHKGAEYSAGSKTHLTGRKARIHKFPLTHITLSFLDLFFWLDETTMTSVAP